MARLEHDSAGQIAALAIKRLLAKRRQRSAPANDDGGKRQR